ncbi:YtxH domain-containing protein [bacterium]|nr:YtxH domain-containing protein [bacterium]
MSVGKFLVGFTIGAALGAVTGILLAPKSGEETREMLSDTAKDILDKTDAKVKDIQDKAEAVVSELQKKGDEIVGNIQNFINEKKEMFKPSEN